MYKNAYMEVILHNPTYLQLFAQTRCMVLKTEAAQDRPLTAWHKQVGWGGTSP